MALRSFIAHVRANPPRPIVLKALRNGALIAGLLTCAPIVIGYWFGSYEKRMDRISVAVIFVLAAACYQFGLLGLMHGFDGTSVMPAMPTVTEMAIVSVVEVALFFVGMALRVAQAHLAPLLAGEGRRWRLDDLGIVLAVLLAIIGTHVSGVDRMGAGPALSQLIDNVMNATPEQQAEINAAFDAFRQGD